MFTANHKTTQRWLERLEIEQELQGKGGAARILPIFIVLGDDPPHRTFTEALEAAEAASIVLGRPYLRLDELERPDEIGDALQTLRDGVVLADLHLMRLRGLFGPQGQDSFERHLIEAYADHNPVIILSTDKATFAKMGEPLRHRAVILDLDAEPRQPRPAPSAGGKMAPGIRAG